MTLRPLTILVTFFVGFTNLVYSQSPAPKPDWPAGQEIGLAVDVGPLGATRDFEVQPSGVANVFGNGPYDLLVSGRTLLPFKRFTRQGVPVFGHPSMLDVPRGSLAVFSAGTTSNALVYNGKKIQLSRFDRSRQRFEITPDFSATVPGGLRTLAAFPLTDDRLAVLFTKGDGKSRGVEGAHPHSADYRPFDGSGIYRGKLSYAVLGAMTLENGNSDPEIQFPIFPAQRDFLIRCTGLTKVDYPSLSRQGVMGAASQGMFYYFQNDSESALDLKPGVFLSGADDNGMRHPGIFPGLVAIPDPVTGDSNLLVGDTGSLWFYRFAGRFNQRGGPIYDPPVRALIENPILTLGALPVLTSGDLDGDGLIDMVAGNDAGHFLFVRNIGTPEKAEFDAPVRIKADGEILKIDGGYTGIQGPPESRWGYSCPTVVDWNRDGSADIIYNSIQGDLSVLLQQPGSSPPSFDKPVILKSDTMEMHLVWRTQPAVTDWNVEQGPQCIIVNDENNQFRRYWQIDDYNVTPGEVLRLTTGEPIQAHGKRFAGQFGRTKLQATDWDGDGKIDLLAGTGRAASIPGPGGIPDDTFEGDRRQASVLFLRNAGTNREPVFDYPRVMHFDQQKLEMGVHTCSPLAIDLGRGKLDLLVGEEDGCVIYFPRERLSWVDVR
ncbi:FG-GAP-like repeat-containing protein [Stieleria sp. TO1_6]|uniref:FG-GAP repeat domain-containing protein n=1 Tax=Stieleria tagensis TaxID=2956795 RepID=UPI00209B7FBF|nr:VCBS repeat-containing protein [Stieleria tagensis]MCO8122018.1 FG-GAP-like repeat-containing protein [Stieleria tagensis]